MKGYKKTPNMELIANGNKYSIIRLLGHGKGGYSYLADSDDRKVVVKKIHHEPCEYYAFGDKIEAEINDYHRLKNAGIRIPEMLEADRENECLVKEYIEGETVAELIKHKTNIDDLTVQVREMAEKAKRAGLNIDYFPTNFVVSDEVLWYIDYECNNYMEEWDFENWGNRYWSYTPEFIEKVIMKDLRFIDLKEAVEMEDTAAQWFHEKWKVPKEAYLECMDEYLSGQTEYGWYLCLDGNQIVGGLGVIENDFHDRKDLKPNVCAVYTEKPYRRLGIAGRLLDMAVEELRGKGISPVYLVTDHTGFYERYGWEFYCMVQGDGEEEPSRLYIHR